MGAWRGDFSRLYTGFPVRFDVTRLYGRCKRRAGEMITKTGAAQEFVPHTSHNLWKKICLTLQH